MITHSSPEIPQWSALFMRSRMAAPIILSGTKPPTFTTISKPVKQGDGVDAVFCGGVNAV